MFFCIIAVRSHKRTLYLRNCDAHFGDLFRRPLAETLASSRAAMRHWIALPAVVDGFKAGFKIENADGLKAALGRKK